MLGPEFRIKNKYINAALLLLLIVGTTIIAIRQTAPSQDTTPQVRKFRENIFGTIMHVTYTSPTDLHDTIMNTLRQVDSSLSMFNPKSTLSLINSGQSTHTDHHLRHILPLAHSISQATDGAFDITVAPLVNAWGFGFKNGTHPNDHQVDSLLRHVGYDKIHLNPDSTLTKDDPHTIIDLSAIAKGYGTDCVARALSRNNVRHYMIEIGGEIVTHGNNPQGQAWQIGITRPDETNTNPNDSGDIEEILQLHNSAMATSGNYRNYYITPDGRRLAHTIDPRTGRPIQHNILSATVLAPTCAIADAYATSFMVLGIDKARAILRHQPQLRAYLIYTDPQGRYSTWTNIPGLTSHTPRK